jgi:hypothetical protein
MTLPTVDNLPPIHPGEILKDELEALSMSPHSFAEHIRVPADIVTAVLNGECGVKVIPPFLTGLGHRTDGRRGQDRRRRSRPLP